MNEQLKKTQNEIFKHQVDNNFFKNLKFRAFDVIAKKMIFNFSLLNTSNNEYNWSAFQFTNDDSYNCNLNEVINNFFQKRGDVFNIGNYLLIDISDFYGIYNYYIMQYTTICDNTKFDELSDDEKIKINKKDWKGYEIYEGDIIQLNSNIKNYKYVIFRDGAYYLSDADGENLILLNLIKSKYSEAKVVGNIFQNSDILNLFKK